MWWFSPHSWLPEVHVEVNFKCRGDNTGEEIKILLSFSPLWTGIGDGVFWFTVCDSCRGDSQERSSIFILPFSPLCFSFFPFGLQLFTCRGDSQERRCSNNSRSPLMNRKHDFVIFKGSFLRGQFYALLCWSILGALSPRIRYIVVGCLSGYPTICIYIV